MAKHVAKQLTGGFGIQVEREDGDACQRDGCVGTLRERGASGIMECSGCHFTFGKRYSLPPPPKEIEGTPGVTIPHIVINRFAQLLHRRAEERKTTNPNDRSGWDRILDPKREEYREDAKTLLTPIWSEIADWFGFTLEERERQTHAINAIQEVAIPSLLFCEERYGHDDQARLNLEAAIRQDQGEDTP